MRPSNGRIGEERLPQDPRRGWRQALSATLVVGLLVAASATLGVGLRSTTGIPTAMVFHGALMFVAWGAMIPAGAVVARYFKVTPRQDFPARCDNPFWWRWHRILQYGGVAMSTAALAAILSVTGGRFDTMHGRIGVVVMAVGWLQVVSAALRGTKGGPTDERADPCDPGTWRGDHFDMSRRRRLFEGWHKRVGWAAVGLAGLNILLGIDLVGAPAWLLLLAAAVQGGIVLAIVDGRIRRRWVDTHVAIWGPDPPRPVRPRDAEPSAAGLSRKPPVLPPMNTAGR